MSAKWRQPMVRIGRDYEFKRVARLAYSYTLRDVTPYGGQDDWGASPAGWPLRPTYG